MVIYGVGLLAGCMLVGLWVGRLLGHALGVEANVGGVGIAMLLLLFFTQLSPKSPVLGPISASGVSFWSAMYIPIVVAMAAKQNVVAAVSSGWVAILAGALAVLASFALVPVLARWAPKDENDA